MNIAVICDSAHIEPLHDLLLGKNKSPTWRLRRIDGDWHFISFQSGWECIEIKYWDVILIDWNFCPQKNRERWAGIIKNVSKITCTLDKNLEHLPHV